MAGNLTVEQCGQLFQTRQASSNYGIDSSGRVGMYVEEKDRSWCSSSPDNDHRAITIEVANDGGEPDWHVSDTAYKKLIELCVDVCKRNGIPRLNYTGDTSGNLTRHNMFTPTCCPGPYLQSKFNDIANEVNEKLMAENYIGNPVSRDIYSDQVEVVYNKLRGRLYPTTSGSTWGKYVTPGVYNIKDLSKDVVEADGYTWYRIQYNINGIGDDLWCANASESIKFYPKQEPPVPPEPSDWEQKYKELLVKYDKLEIQAEDLQAENDKLSCKIDKVKEVSDTLVEILK